MKCPHYYAAWNRDDAIRVASTSGGVFSALADVVLEEGGIVIGAAYDKDMNVRHEIVDSREELKRLRGAKYVHGAIGPDVYAGIKDALNIGRKVLFSGLPCQVAAMCKMFGANANLLLVDLVCFGAPSNDLWLKYISWREEKKGKKLKYVTPRDKANGWGRKTYYRYEWQDGSVERCLSLYDPYSYAFYTCLGFRKCCFTCPFRGVDRVSDITLGDFWGAEKLNPPPAVLAQGVSGVMVHTRKGQRSFDSAVVERLQVDANMFLAGNPCVLTSPRMPEKWDAFAADSRAMDFGSLIGKYGLQITRWQVFKRSMRQVLSSVVPEVVKRRLRSG